MPLSDTGLVVRYYIDEATSGTAPTQVIDAGANAYHLTEVNYGTGDPANRMEYVEIGGNRGLESFGVTGVKRARRAINDTSDAFRNAMAGVQKTTIELMLRLDSGNANGGRVFGINGRAGENGRLLVKAPTTGTALRVAWNDTDSGDSSSIGVARTVVHLVIDSTLGSGNRAKLYKDGSLIVGGIDADTAIPLNSTLSLPASQDLIALNRESSGSFDRSIDGVLFYAAMYNVAFDSTRVSDHHTVLSADDDAPGAAPVEVSWDSTPIFRPRRGYF